MYLAAELPFNTTASESQASGKHFSKALDRASADMQSIILQDTHNLQNELRVLFQFKIKLVFKSEATSNNLPTKLLSTFL